MVAPGLAPRASSFSGQLGRGDGEAVPEGEVEGDVEGDVDGELEDEVEGVGGSESSGVVIERSGEPTTKLGGGAGWASLGCGDEDRAGQPASVQMVNKVAHAFTPGTEMG